MHQPLLAPLVLLVCLLASGTAGANEPLPRPAGLESNVRFWTRIYSEVDSRGGLIHDTRHLDVVYESVLFSKGMSRRARERVVEKAKRRTAAVLKRLAGGKRTGLSESEAQALALWPAGVSNATLRAAARNIRFQLGQADRFKAGLARAGAWRDDIEQVLSGAGVPLELSALPHVESSFNPLAYSSVGAAGLWQFTRSTGRLFMRVDNVIDERLDSHKASVGAAKLLRANYDRLGTWPLAITAYNHGVAGIARAVRKVGTTDIATISKTYKGRTFGFASRNFYAEFLAALEIDRNAERYFGPIHRDQPVPSESVVLDHFYTPATLEKAFGVDVATLRAYNPALRPAVWNNTKYIPRGFELRLPPDTLSLSAAEVFAAIPPGERKAEQHRDRFHKVRRGDTLSTIARRYRVRERELVTANNLRSRHRIRAGQVLVLPDHAAGGSRTVARSARPADGIYRVRRGDSLSIIARRFGVSESSLVAENSLRNRHRIAVGQRLRIPGAKPVVVAAVAPSSQAQKPAVPAPRRIAETPPPAPDPAPAATPVSPPSSAAIGVTASRPAAAAAPGTALTAAAAASVATPRAAKLPANVPIPDPSDYAVGGGNRITVQATETLGHYAEWLEIATSRLRRLNGMRYNTPVVIGRKIKLDFSRVTPETFEIRRLEHHHTLQEEYFSAFEVTGTRGHVLRPGDSLWYLALQKYQVPIWLIRQFNPDVDLGSLRAGTRLVIPEVSNRTS